MASLRSPRAQKNARLEIIPFIDIMFFLLATFMMASLSMVQNEGIDLNLPQAATSLPSQELPKNNTVSIDADGNLFLNEQATSLEEAKPYFAQLFREDPETKVIVQGDYQCDYGKVVEVFDLARSQGLTKLILRTRKPEVSP
ncbi:MAG: biopolymer transporter ExbD [Verrucomicrobiota bacterium]